MDKAFNWNTIPLKDRKDHLIDKLKSIDSLSEKMRAFKDVYKDKDCVILNCGPSFGDYSPEEYREKLSDKVVFAIKTTFNIVPDIVDFHFWNCCNLPMPRNDTCAIKRIFYDYEDFRPAVIASSNFDLDVRIGSNQIHDVFLKIPDTPSDLLVNNKNYEDFSFDNSFERPCGPGILHETVIYTAMYTGVKSITTIGFDLSCNKENNKVHFYSNKLHIPGIIYPGEKELMIDTFPDFYNWIISKGVEFKICSKINPVSSQVPRTTI